MTASAAMAAGAAALGRGDLVVAEQEFARAVTLDPALADGWFNLGWVQRAARKFDAALGSYARAIEEGVAGPEEAHVNRAAIFSDHLFRPEDAAVEYGLALQRQPGFPPALIGLAQLHEDEGRREEASDCYRALLRAYPADGRSLARLASLELSGGADPEAIAHALRNDLAKAQAPDDRVELLFARAAALDSAGAYAEAFDNLTEANELAASLSPARYDAFAVERLVDASIAAFPDPIGVDRIDPAAPIFICGLFRSGSTLAEQVLARHPSLVAGGELEAIPAISAELRPYPDAVTSLDASQIAALRDRYRAEARRIVPPGRRHTDKRCDNVFHLGVIQRLFLGAPVIHTERHPLDNLLSTLFLRFGDGVAYAHRWEDAMHHAVQERRLTRHWQRIMPDLIQPLDYDRLVHRPREALEPILSFLGLEWEDSLLGETASAPVRTASNWQVRQPIHARSSGRWRHYAAQLEPARRAFEAAGFALDD